MKRFVMAAAALALFLFMQANAAESSTESALHAMTVVEIAEHIHQLAADEHSGVMAAYTNTIPNTKARYAMTPVTGGEFMMGSPSGSRLAQPAEQPTHRVKVASFWIGKFEVTWDEFNAFVFDDIERRQSSPPPLDGRLEPAQADAVTHPSLPYVDTDSGMGRKGFPAIAMTQHAANKYCQWLSAKTGHFYRLPTEAEWEYAARAGTTNTWFFGEDESQLGTYAWLESNCEFHYHKVGTRLPNPWGIYDMLGNVSEWVLDQYDPHYYELCAQRGILLDPWNRASKPYPHSVRGGSWRDPAARVHCAARDASSPDWKLADPQLPKSLYWLRSCDYVGFRIVRPRAAPTIEAMDRYWNSHVERD